MTTVEISFNFTYFFLNTFLWFHERLVPEIDICLFPNDFSLYKRSLETWARHDLQIIEANQRYLIILHMLCYSFWKLIYTKAWDFSHLSRENSGSQANKGNHNLSHHLIAFTIDLFTFIAFSSNINPPSDQFSEFPFAS